MLPMKKYLSRKEASAYLTEIGFHTTYKTLGKLATIGGGPKFHKFGTKSVLYAIEDLDAWAAERLSPAFKSGGCIMSKKRKSFLIYIDTLPLFDELNDEDELSLCRAINHYHRDLPIELTAVARPLFKIFQAQFERDNERYLARCEKNRASVLKRYERQQSNTNESECERPNTDSTDRDRESDRDRGRERDIIPLSFKFSPYCSETMPEELRQAAEALNFQGDAAAVYLRFRNYWLQRETKKADWVSAWRNWLSREKPMGTVAERNARILNRRYGDG